MIVYRGSFISPRHSEPVRTLAWESVPLRLTEPRDALHRKNTDCHGLQASLAMTVVYGS